MSVAKEANENSRFDAFQAVEDVAKMRSASRWILNICLESENYRDAAELVSGVCDGFQLCLRRIEDVVASLSCDHASVSDVTDPESVLAVVLREIIYYRIWSQSVLDRLPGLDGEAPLRVAFLRADQSRALLLDELRSANEECLRWGAGGIDAQAIEGEAANV